MYVRTGGKKHVYSVKDYLNRREKRNTTRYDYSFNPTRRHVRTDDTRR